MRDHAWSASPWWGTLGGMWDTRVGRRTPDNHSTTAIERREIYKYIYICTICILYLRVCSWNGSHRRASGSWDFCAAASSRRECPSDSRHCHHIGLGRRTSTWNCCAARPGGRRWWYSLQLRLRAYREAPHCCWDLGRKEERFDIICSPNVFSFAIIKRFQQQIPPRLRIHFSSWPCCALYQFRPDARVGGGIVKQQQQQLCSGSSCGLQSLFFCHLPPIFISCSFLLLTHLQNGCRGGRSRRLLPAACRALSH